MQIRIDILSPTDLFPPMQQIEKIDQSKSSSYLFFVPKSDLRAQAKVRQQYGVKAPIAYHSYMPTYGTAGTVILRY